MLRYLKWAVVTALAINVTLAADEKRAVNPQDESKVTLLSAQQIDSMVRKAPDRATGTISLDLVSYSPEKGGAVMMWRAKPARAEVHKRLIDVWYVIKGEGTLVTGGSLLEPAETEPGELRGSGIKGGDERHIAAGDFVRIPAGVPHWVRKIDGEEILYLVVKTSR